MHNHLPNGELQGTSIARLPGLCLIAPCSDAAGSLSGNAPEFVPTRRYGSTGLGDDQGAVEGQLPRTLRVQRPCRCIAICLDKLVGHSLHLHRDQHFTWQDLYECTCTAVHQPWCRCMVMSCSQDSLAANCSNP